MFLQLPSISFPASLFFTLFPLFFCFNPVKASSFGEAEKKERKRKLKGGRNLLEKGVGEELFGTGVLEVTSPSVYVSSVISKSW